MALIRKKTVIKFIPCVDKHEIVVRISNAIFDQIKKKNNSVIGFGASLALTDLYDQIAVDFKNNNISFKDVVIINSDEYVDLDHRYTKYSKVESMKNLLFKRTDINLDNTFFPTKENYKTFDKMIHKFGGIDLLVLLPGSNGYIAFNEPNTKLNAKTHISKLENNTRLSMATIFDEKINVPYYAVTIGIKTILESKKIILMASGNSLSVPVSKLFENQYSPI
jgi:glucosamine-6-phosphate deaminase